MYIGLDLGMGNCKAWGFTNGLAVASHVAIDNGQTVSHLAGMKASQPPAKISIDGRSFFVGANAHAWGRAVESLDYDRLTGSPEIRAVFYATMSSYMQAYGRIEQPIKVVAGLPLEPLTGDEGAVKATVTAVQGWLKRHHTWLMDGAAYDLEVESVRIMPQPAGALSDFLLDDNGRSLPAHRIYAKNEIGVISIGFNTIELLVMQNSVPVQRFTAGYTSGVRRLLELVNGDGLYSLGELDSQLRAGNLPHAEDALNLWAREIDGQIEKTWGKAWRRFARVVMVGGGAVLLNGRLSTKFNGKGFMPDEPILSIARGLRKAGMAREGK